MLKRDAELEKFIMDQERYTPDAFDDHGRTSIGYGTKGVPGQRVSEKKAKELMLSHLDTIEKEIAPHLTRTDLPQNKQNVILDVGYNLGTPRLLETGILDLINQGKDSEVAEALLRINKARNKQGVLEVLPGLDKRAKLRKQMWEMASTPTQEGGSSILEEFDAIAGVDSSVIAEFDEIVKEASTPSTRNSFGLATDISNKEELEKERKIDNFANQHKIPRGQAEALLSEFDEATANLKLEARRIEKSYPKTAEFGAEVANNALVKEEPQTFKRLEFLTKVMGGERSEFTKALNSSFLRFDRGLLTYQALNGLMSVEDAVKRFEASDALVAQNRVNNSTTANLQKAGKSWDIAYAILKDSLDKGELAGVAEGASKVASAAGMFFLESVMEPSDFLAFQLEQGGAGLIATGFAGPVGRGAIEAATAYGGIVDEKLQEYAHPETGKIDYAKFLKDKEALAILRTEAITYASSIGLISGAYTKVGGKLISKKGMSGALAATALGASSEVVGEVGARTAGQLASGQEVDTEGNLKEGFVEGLAGTPTAVASAGVNYVLNRGAGARTGKKLYEANKAQDATMGASEMKEDLINSKMAEENPEQMKDFVNRAAESEPVQYTSDESENTVNRNVIQEEKNIDSTSVSISPAEWAAFNEDRGVDSLDALSVFSDEVKLQFASNAASDTSVVISRGEWIVATRQDPEIDVIARFGGNEFNALEGNEVVDAFQKNPMIFFDTTENTTSIEDTLESQIPEIPADAMNFIEEGNDGGMTRIPLEGPFQTIEEGEAFENFKNRFKKSLPDLDENYLNDIALLELRRFRVRAGIANLSLGEALNRIKVTKGDQSKVETPSMETDFFKITLGKGANPTSVIHELAHVWLYEMAEDSRLIQDIDPETMTPDVREYVKAMKDAIELLGLDSLDEVLLGGSSKVTMAQETFAQTAEKFFLEGHSDSPRVKTLMDRMRSWMVKYYDKLRKLAQSKYPTLSMSPKVKNMFEGILGATNAATDAIGEMFPQPMFDRTSLGDTKTSNDYLESWSLARSEAIANVAGKAMEKGERENMKVFDSAYLELWRDSEAEVDSLPSMVMRAMVEDAYTEAKKKGTPDPRLSYESVRDTFFEGDENTTSEFKKSIPFYMMTGKKKGGVSVDQYMMMLNLSNPQELFNMLSESANREQMIQDRVDARVEEIRPKLKSKEEIAQMAREAVSGEGRFNLIKKEVKIFQQKFPTQFKNLTADLINAATNLIDDAKAEELNKIALDSILSSKASGFNSLTYFRDMNRKSAEAATKFKRGDLEQAIKAKVMEAHKELQFKYAYKAAKNLATAKARVKRLQEVHADRTNFTKYERFIVDNVFNLVAEVINGGNPTKLNYDQLVDQPNVTPSMIDEINKAIEGLVVTDNFGEDLTVEGMIALGKLARTSIKQAAAARSAFIDGKKEAIDKLAELFVGEDLNNHVVSYENTNEESGTWFSSNRAMKTKARAGLSLMYKSEEDFAKSVPGRLWHNITEGTANRALELVELKKRVGEDLKKVPLTFREKVISDATLKKVGAKKPNSFTWQVGPEKVFNFLNFDELEAAMMHLGSESGARGLVVGNLGLNETEISKVTESFWNYVSGLIEQGSLPKEYLDVLQTKWNILKELYPRVSETIEKSDGIPLNEIKGWKVKVGGRTLEGAYFPKFVQRDPNIDAMVKASEGSTEMFNITSIGNKDMRITKERNHDSSIPLNAAAFEGYLNAATSIIHVRAPFQSMVKFIRQEKVAERLEAIRPGLVSNVLAPALSRSMLNTRDLNTNKQADSFDFYDYVRRNTGMVFFLANVKSVLSQGLGLFPVMRELGAAPVLKAALDLKSLGAGFFEQVRSLSPIMRDRALNDLGLNIRGEDSFNEGRTYGAAAERVSQKAAYGPMAAMQNVVDTLAWRAAYDKASKTMTQEEAIRFADNITEKTQGSANVAELTNIQASSGLTRLFTAFATVPLLNYEIMADVINRRSGVDVTKAKDVAVATAFTMMLPAMVETMLLENLMEAIGLKEEEEEEDELTNGIIKAVGTAGQTLFMTPIPNALFNAALKVSPVADEGSVRATPPVVKKFQDSINGSVGAYESMANKKPMTNRQVSQFLDLATILIPQTGVVTAPASRYMIYKQNNMTENEKALERILRRQQR